MQSRSHSTQRPGRPAVLLLAEGTGLALQAIYCLRDMGARIDIAGRPPARLLRWSRYCSRFFELDFHPRVNNPDAVRERICEIAHDRELDVVVPVGHLSMGVLERIQTGLAIPCFPVPSEAAVQAFDDKWAVYELCGRLGVPAPRSVRFESKAEIHPNELKDQIGFPLVIKPTGQGGHSGVVICRSVAELSAMVLANEKYAYKPLIAQEFIAGQETDLTVLAIDGKVVAHSVQRHDGKTLVFQEDAALVESGRKLVDAVGYNGLAHFDAVRDPKTGELKVFDCNPRVSASICASAFCGLNFLAGGIALACGEQWVAREIEDGSTFLAPAHALMAMFGMRRLEQPISLATWRGLRCAIGDAPTFVGEYVLKLTGD
jgi:biotin carboxylase